IGGIMGGEDTGVTEASTDIVIECAFFDPDRIALTGQKLQLTSDARTRFERGVDPAFLDPGLAIATELAIQLAGGEASRVVHAGEPPEGTKTISYYPHLSRQIVGFPLGERRQREILTRLGFGVEGLEDDWTIHVPSWRR